MVSKIYLTDTITNDFPESICCWCTFYTHKFLCFHFELNFYLCSSFWIYLSKKVLFIFPISYAQNCEIVLTHVKSSKIFIKASRALKPSLYKFKFSNSLLRRFWWKPKNESSSFCWIKSFRTLNKQKVHVEKFVIVFHYLYYI